MKATAIAPSNIAFIKYWGRKDEALRLPTNGSISMNLSNLLTTTTVEFDEKLKNDSIEIRHPGLSRIRILDASQKGTYQNDNFRVIKHLDRIRSLAGVKTRAKVVSQNNFPSATGLSSSASGFAALTLAASKAAGLHLSEKELSILARQGSGSACRSIPDGFVKWYDGNTSEESFATSLFAPNYWDIVDIVTVISEKKKVISTTEGQTRIASSPLFAKRMKTIGKKIELCKKYIAEKNFQKFGELIEAEALELHEIMRTSKPPLDYLFPETKALIKTIEEWRMSGILVYWTLNTGQNVHVIVEQKNSKKVLGKINSLPYVLQAIVNHPAKGARVSTKHLF